MNFHLLASTKNMTIKKYDIFKVNLQTSYICKPCMFETITRDSSVHLEGGEGEVSPGLFCKIEKSALILEKSA